MSDEWKIYRTRFLARARQLTEAFSFIDASGRENHGGPGDYLVQSSEGPRIVRREVFEDVYTVLEPQAVLGLPSSRDDRQPCAPS